ncbi:G-protein coupled receptor Mth2-like isoform X1 [Contarinia nasturtii]|uniref:G-protein coupled receptor Mth2-like isoform X1 n=1 Tax=Contarinia nasturtii TaxID=265458 RepID=UPI0012D3A7B4|nr:G-protein coupled receptor Mth2-like isoform X1 [Contarinia nasturtii]
MSFDLYQNLRSSNKFQPQFSYYVVYAFGLPLFLTLFTLQLDKVNPLGMHDKWLPGIATKICFFKKGKDGKLAPFLYFHMLICIIYAVDLVLFILTAVKIHKAQRDILKLTSQVESARHQSNLNNERDNWIRSLIMPVANNTSSAYSEY